MTITTLNRVPTKAILIGCVSENPIVDAPVSACTWLELRADIPASPEVPLRAAAVRSIFALRSRAEGGRADSDPESRAAVLMQATDRHALVELEAQRDLHPAILNAIPPERRVIAWHGEAADLDTLRRQFQRMQLTPARWYKLVLSPSNFANTTLAPQLLLELARDDVTVYADGPEGLWTRVLAPRWGAPLVYGSFKSGDCTSIGRLMDDYGLPDLPDIRTLHGIVGDPVSHSLSPRFHNRAHRLRASQVLYLAFQTGDLGAFWRHLIDVPWLVNAGLRIDGLTAISPCKETALRRVERIGPTARRAGSVNVLWRDGQRWVGDTTDAFGAREGLVRNHIATSGLNAIVMGCGGAGRTIAGELLRQGARVTLANRGSERANRAADLLGIKPCGWNEFDPAAYQLLVNATPLGSAGEAPFDLSRLQRDSVVIDLAYGKQPTPLAEAARLRGCTLIDGRDTLELQAGAQFRLMNAGLPTITAAATRTPLRAPTFNLRARQA